jgi:LacI family transcriptional regulator
LRGDPQIPARTRDRIRKVAREMGYQRNALVAHLMAQLRGSQTTVPFQAKLALVNAHSSRDAFRSHSTIPTYVAGCEARASQLGYSFDTFWLHDPELTADRWIRILAARGIQGIVIIGLTDQNKLPPHLRPVWNVLPTVVARLRTRDPALPFSCVDHYHLTLAAVEKALELGYRRPGLVIGEASDRLVDGRYYAGMLAAQEALPEQQRIRTFRDSSPANPDHFRTWFDNSRPHYTTTWSPGWRIVVSLRRTMSD